MTYIAFEGGVCVGKSVASKHLAEANKYHHLPEYMEMLPPHHISRKLLLPPLRRLDLFIGLDHQRNKLIKSMPGDIVGDRCLMSIMGFEYGISRLEMPTILPNAIQEFDYRVMLPTILIFFEVASELRKERWLQRGGSVHSIMIRPEFNEAIKECFVKVSDIANIWFIDATDLSVAQMAEHGQRAISKANKAGKSYTSLALSELVSIIFE